MALSSLIFGGLSLWHARQDKFGILGSTELDFSLPAMLLRILDWQQHAFYRIIDFIQTIDPRTYAWLMSTLCLLILLAYSTNPTDASFRSYLTELSLHRHLHQIRKESVIPAEILTDKNLEGITKSESDKATPGHILTFANRISVSLRTPRYERCDFGIFCTVIVPSSPLLGDEILLSTRYVGLFGKWWVFGQIRKPKKNHQKIKQVNGRNQDVWGVLRMQAGGEESDFVDNEKLSVENATGQTRVYHSKLANGVHESEGIVASSVGKPSGRRKKQTHKAKPSIQHTEIELLSSEKCIGEESSSVIGGIPSRLNDSLQKGPDAEQSSPPVSATSNTPHEAIGNVDLQMQLEQVRLTSESSKKLLQAQLEELRNRKKDEDAVRLDVKGRMKALDESKRQAEGTKREAERRLKAANALRETLENRIVGKVQEMKDWKEKEYANTIQVQQSGEKKTLKIAEIKKEIQIKEEESQEAEVELEQLKTKLLTVQQRLLEEEANLEAVRELAAEKDAAMIARQGFNSSSTSLYHNSYPHLSGPGEYSDHLLGDMSMDGQSLYAGRNSHYNSYGSGPLHQMSMFIDDVKDHPDETFDPTIAEPMHLEFPPTKFAPFTYDSQSVFQLREIQAPTPSRVLGEGAYVPPSPFTSDLLPSNLFQNADDDEKHIGVLPGSRSEQVEAALNRFGLDTSDTSDAGESEKEREEDIAEDHSEDEDKHDHEASDKELSRSANGTFGTAARTWWNSRGRNTSKDRSTRGNSFAPSDDRVSAVETSITGRDQDLTKRRSLSMFPKLSLNPGAKSFRGSHKKVVEENVSDDYNYPTMQADWNNSGQDFESMKRAFQTNTLGAPNPDDEEGRKSWSAFDSWQQMQHNGPLSLANGSIDRLFQPTSRTMNSPAHHTQRASSESLQPIRRRFPGSSTSPQGVNWLDDVLLPLQKCQSIDDANSSSTPPSLMPRNKQRMGGKPSRFAFWSKDSNGITHQQLSTQSPSSSAAFLQTQQGGSEVDDDTAASTPTPAIMEASLPTSSVALQPGKRTSFRWSRRSESSTDNNQE